ncbi:hypothetical protein [Actinophytocola algeriensis]|uniref:Uncharacterized protein n=1 Tax=Actinophytocola algeriensis TaxID=1768010 RepID=A0A7W7Q5N6_9PSEU|nr:hypothetical protein [Actinophytocola algeriensis]MBB4907449.1 hypothetical protein [Actinophytocola algeriensis]MBE1479479.1 hypothetical protein [Actinophytocola algeriensis]
MYQDRPRRGLLALLFLGVSLASRPVPDVEAPPGFAFVDAVPRNVLLVHYARQGARGMSQLMAQDVFQVRLTAGNTSTWQQTQAARSPRVRTGRGVRCG